jgi:predicted Zn finger-like uncharacterized protein
MSLLTRCTRCHTLFRVTPAQLQARGGKVRCGRCMNVFDGFQALEVEQADALSEPARFEPQPSPTPATPLTSAPAEPRNDAQPRDEQSSTRANAEPRNDAQPPDERPPAPAPADAEEGFRVALQSVRPPEPAPPIERAPRPRWRLSPSGATAAWVAACALAFFVLALQFAYAARGELAARYPGLKTMFSSLCARVGCTLSFPRKPELVKIEASDVRMLDASRPHIVRLNATLRSYAGYYVAYPALDLVLTNANEHALARRVFVPQEYLGPGRDPNAGFAPHAEITIALDLDTGTENAAGFRLDLLAAP